MYESADTLLAPQFAEVVKKAAQPLFQPIYDLEVPKMNFGRIALLGDAAFVVRPHCGDGCHQGGR
jgi:2-polyprenyl-6-methoxyphenol hydroxylase-like FAD-dependent oxidoreductase